MERCERAAGLEIEGQEIPRGDIDLQKKVSWNGKVLVVSLTNP